MAASGQAPVFNILAVLQGGRLQYEALLLAASLARAAPAFPGRLILAEPQPGPLWPEDPRLQDPAFRAALTALGAEIRPFEAQIFGAAYPQGNKIEALTVLPEAPFLFLDTDTLLLGDPAALPFDFARPAASLRRTDTWPDPPLYGPDRRAIWGALYARFGLDFAASQDARFPENHWQRYLYFNAGWFFHESPARFGALFAQIARAIWHDPPEALAAQSLTPWLDQIALPLVIQALGGGRPGPEIAGPAGLDGAVSCHYRALPLLYARESDAAVETLEALAQDKALKPLFKTSEPFRKLIYQKKGRQIRETLGPGAGPPLAEQALRQRLRQRGLWWR